MHFEFDLNFEKFKYHFNEEYIQETNNDFIKFHISIIFII